MKYFYKSFALGLIVFSSFAFAAEEDVIDVPEKPISDVEFIEPSFVGEEVFVKDEYYDNVEDNIFYTTEIKNDINEDTIYTLGEITPTLIGNEGGEIKPEIIEDGEFVEVKPDILYDENGMVIKPKPPFVEDSEFFPVPPIMTVGGGEIPENEWIYMTANMSPTGNHHNMSGSGNICVSEPFAIMALLSACMAFVSVRRRKEV